MNYLAHIYLSGSSDAIRIGNFIGDYVKGNQFNRFKPEIRQGILLHRKIDSFTDNHPVVQECKGVLRPGYGKFAGVVTDLFFDHFLAANWNQYSHEQLLPYTRDFYALLLQNFLILPTRVKMFLPFMIQHKRLSSYATPEGIAHVLKIMGNHTSLPDKSEYAFTVLQENYPFLHDAFEQFFDELINYVEQEENFPVRLR